MKKILLSAVLILVIAGAGYLIYKYGNSQSQQTSTSATSSSQSSQVVSAVAPASSEAASSAAPSTPKPASSTPNTIKQQTISSIQAAISMDWKKYTLKSSSQTKTLQNKKYTIFEIWDDDYLVGPKILIDPSDSKIYTWTETDTAPVPASEDKAFDETVRTVTGTMVDGAMMNVVLKTPDGSQITVRRLGIDTSGLKSLNIGDKIKVTYTGVIKGSDTSRAFITKLENVK